MARVPTVDGGFVSRQGGGDPALAAPDTTQGGRAIAEGVENLGSALGRQAVEQDAIDAARDEAAAKLLDVEYSEFSRETLWTGEAAFYTKEGFSADAARKDTETAIAQKREELIAKASTERQKKMTEAALQRRVAADMEGVGRHSVAQYRVEEVRQSAARLKGARDDALTYADDPIRFQEELLVGEAEIASASAKAGEAREVAALTIETWRSGVYAARGSELIREGRVDEAIEWVDKSRGELNADDENDLDAALYRPMFERKIDGLADVVMGDGLPVSRVGSEDPDGGGAPKPGAVTVAPTRKGLAIASPVAGGRISSGYGKRTAPTRGASTNHRAIDVAAPKGAPIVAQSDGRVVSAKDEGSAGKVVRIDYGNGVVFSYAHMDGFNVKAGDVVKAGAKLGGVGQTGTATGPHVHIVARVNGQRVDPSKFEGEVGGTLAQAEGSASAPSSLPQRHDLGKLIDKVKSMGLPFEEEKALIAEVKSRVSNDEALIERTERDAVDAVNEIFDRAIAAGKPITRESQIPADVWDKMGPSDRMSVRSIIARNAEPAPRKTDYGQYTRLSELYASDPDAFLRIDPTAYRNALDDTDYERVLGWRRDLLGGGGKGSDKQVSHSRVSTIVGDVRAMAGLDVSGIPTSQGEKRRAVLRRVYKLERAVQRDVEIWQRANPGKTVPDDVIMQSAERQMAVTRNAGEKRGEAAGRDATFWFERDQNNGKYVVDIPRKDVERLRRIGKQELGRMPTDKEVSAAWHAEGRGGY